MNDIKKIFDLDDKESAIFSILIKFQKATVNDLMKKTSIERRTIYDILARLIQKGYVTYINENNVKTFFSTNKEILLESLKKKIEDFKSIMPQFNTGQEKEKHVETLNGIEGMRMVFNEIVSSKKTHYAFGDVSKFVEKAGLDTKIFLSRLERIGVHEKIIYPQGKKALRIVKGEYKFLKKEMVPPTPVIIYANVTFMFLFSDPILIIRINNEEITKSYKAYFDTYWKIAKK